MSCIGQQPDQFIPGRCVSLFPYFDRARCWFQWIFRSVVMSECACSWLHGLGVWIWIRPGKVFSDLRIWVLPYGIFVGRSNSAVGLFRTQFMTSLQLLKTRSGRRERQPPPIERRHRTPSESTAPATSINQPDFCQQLDISSDDEPIQPSERRSNRLTC